MVYYIFAFFIFAAQVFAEEDGDGDAMSCLELFQPKHMEKECCESMDLLRDQVESCKTKDGEWECSNAKCVLDKADLLNGDTLDDKKVAEAIEKIKKERPNDKAMYERVKNKCLEDKFEHYPPKEACPFIKFQICTYINSFVECQTWKPGDACKQLSEHAKKCKSVLDSMKE